MNKYIVEKTANPGGSKVVGESRFYGDHGIKFLELEQFAWHYPKPEAEAKKIELMRDGSNWRIKKL